ncbi:probable protein phosphatase 2C 43 [Trifolium pratense]|uniref:probable protein phosphatase 2C 43 n=1 Tax=Trifolium pratense TaxID=57577 RepID=UPI001E69446F|nr:probable protein phosphatase 2C 43 [Trifolium pratense]
MFQWLTNLLCACTTNTSKNTVDINEFDEDPLGWSRDLLEQQLGEFSMAAVKANDVMEDHSQLDVGKKALFVGIYDGHNGAEASNFLITNLFENLIRIIQENNNNVSENILRQVVAEMEELFMTDVEEGNQQRPELALVGSSCLFCMVWRGRLYIANVGGSRAVMGSLDPFDRFNVRQLVEDHNARNRHIKKELKKLHPNNPTIVTYNFDAWRVGGISEVSRCIGNAYLKRAPFTLTSSFRVPQLELAPSDFTRPLLSAEPAISSRVLNDVDKFIIFGSGGLWKLLSNWQAAEIVHTNPRDGIAKRILMTALQIAARRNNMSYSELSKIHETWCWRIQRNNNNMNINILMRAVARLERAFLESAGRNVFVSSGCLICFIRRGTLYAANVGDSHAVLGSLMGDIQDLSDDKGSIETTRCIGYAYLKKEININESEIPYWYSLVMTDALSTTVAPLSTTTDALSISFILRQVVISYIAIFLLGIEHFSVKLVMIIVIEFNEMKN